MGERTEVKNIDCILTVYFTAFEKKGIWRARKSGRRTTVWDWVQIMFLWWNQDRFSDNLNKLWHDKYKTTVWWKSSERKHKIVDSYNELINWCENLD